MSVLTFGDRLNNLVEDVLAGLEVIGSASTPSSSVTIQKEWKSAAGQIIIENGACLGCTAPASRKNIVEQSCEYCGRGKEGR